MVNFTTQTIVMDELYAQELKTLYKAAKPKQKDLVANVVAFVTKSVKEPYMWERMDFMTFLDTSDVPYNFEKLKKFTQQYKKDNDYTGFKIISYYTDLFDLKYNLMMPEYCFVEVKPKTKTYINGKKADKTFLAAKGNMYVNKNGGV